jgi:hypothetical protein
VWSGFKDEEKLGGKIPIPQSNTVDAKNMRVAAILAILARSVDRNIFQPTYHLDFNSGLRELFVQQAAKNSKRESCCRAFLLPMFPQYQERVVSTAEPLVLPSKCQAGAKQAPPSKYET